MAKAIYKQHGLRFIPRLFYIFFLLSAGGCGFSDFQMDCNRWPGEGGCPHTVDHSEPTCLPYLHAILSWEGRYIDELLKYWGKPTRIVDVPPHGKKHYIWLVVEEHQYGLDERDYDFEKMKWFTIEAPRSTFSCKTTATVDEDGRVIVMLSGDNIGMCNEMYWKPAIAPKREPEPKKQSPSPKKAALKS